MAKPLITRLNLESETSNQNGGITRTYKVEGTNLNVVNVRTATSSNGRLKLPKYGDPDPHNEEGNKSFVTDVDITHRGKYDASGDSPGYLEARVKYVDAKTFSEKEGGNGGGTGGGGGGRQKSSGLYEFPWDEKAKIAKTGESIEVDMWGRDERDQVLLYSSGDPVNLQQPYPLSNISVTFAKKLNDVTDWWALEETIRQTVNNAAVTLRIANKVYTYAARTLLVAGFDVTVEYFNYKDPLTLQTKIVPYFQISMNLLHRKNTWATLIPDRGHKVIDPVTNLVVSPKNTEEKDIEPELVYLNGQGQRLLAKSTTAGRRDPDNAYAGGTKTPYNVTIAKSATEAIAAEALAEGGDGVVRMVLLAFLTYEEVDFTPLGLANLVAELV